MHLHRELISIARELAVRDTGKPKYASLARSVSSAYYALFHALAYFCARETISTRYWIDFKLVYRSIDHGRTKASFLQIIKDSNGAGHLSLIGQEFISLQQERHKADYGIVFESSRPMVRDLIDRAEQAIDLLERLDIDDRKRLTARLIAGRGRAA